MAAVSNLADDGAPILSKCDYYRITSDYERKVNAMDSVSRAKIIKNLSTENFFQTNSQLLHNVSDRNFVKNTFPTSENVYSDANMVRVHSLWTPKNKFETFLGLKKRDLAPLDVKGKIFWVNENKSKGTALIKPIRDPLEIVKDESLAYKTYPYTEKM